MDLSDNPGNSGRKWRQHHHVTKTYHMASHYTDKIIIIFQILKRQKLEDGP